ncbi:uncharacterized protein LOC143144275 isoform X1 [Ptiloglossa arizonensis]|uniref:uncharacterized protein LOC143144275 isoform X1 n=1 Tax=Ptiloglossa arizonensis TaxID=3350558 RepID=UPI003F9FEDC5
MAVNIKFTKFDNTPWGFRLAGGSDFPQPLTVIRVLEGSLAECMGLKVGDVVVRLNDQPISSLTHGQAHEELMRAGNNFVLGVLRKEDSLKALEALSEENIVPYKIPLADLPPVFPEQILKEETVIERCEVTTTYEEKLLEEEVKPEVEPLPDKPKDANSEIVPNQNLTDDEIAQLILEEEELLNDKGVLGVNFKKLRPRVTVLKQSKVVEELQNLATEEAPLVEQLKRTSVFLQKPQRPIPSPRKKPEEQEETEVESYKVVIKKQQRRNITDRLLESGLLKPEGAKTPEPPTPEVNMDSNEVKRVEVDDTTSCPRSQHQERTEPRATCTEVFTTCLEIGPSRSHHDIEPVPCSRKTEQLEVFTTCLEIDPSRSLLNNDNVGPCSQQQERFEPTATSLEIVPSRSPNVTDTDPSSQQQEQYEGTILEIPDRSILETNGAPSSDEEQLESTIHEVPARSTLDVDPCQEQLVVITTCSLVSLEPDNARVATDVATTSFKRNETSPSRRTPGKRKFKRFYTRAHYFRRCLFGKKSHPEAKKPAKARPAHKERPRRENETEEYPEPIVDESRRGSLEKSNRSRIKGRYLETYLKREDNWMRRMLDGLLECPEGITGRLFERLVTEKGVTSRRTRYAEKILARSVQYLAARLRRDVLVYLERGRSPGTSSPALPKSRARGRLYFKGRYVQRVLWRNLARLMNYVTGVPKTVDTRRRRSSGMIKMKGRYVEKCLLRNTGGLFESRDRSARVSTTTTTTSKRRKKNILVRARYAERIVKMHLESLGTIVGYVRRHVLQGVTDPYADRSSSTDFEKRDEGGITDLIRSSKDFISTEVFHRGSRRLSRSSRGSVSVDSRGSSLLRNFAFDFNWLPSIFAKESPHLGEKRAQEGDRDRRRLSFVPTVLYEGLTNRIGVDFTRLVAYAFVPCTSLVLLYMYK